MTSARGYKYMMVEYEQDSNDIMVEPTKSKEGTELTKAYKAIQNTLKDRGLKPKIHILDNEYSNTLKNSWQNKRNFSSWYNRKFT